MFLFLALFTILLGRALFFYIPSFSNHQTNVALLKKVSIIIPARNEERNLPKLLSSLLPYKKLVKEIIVVDDQSTDNTQEVVRAFDMNLVILDDLPKKWAGKSYGCWSGANTAKGDIFLFIDADTVVEEEGLERLVAAYQGSGTVVSVHPYHSIKKWYESFSAFFHLVVMGSLGVFHLFQGWKKVNGAFGPCLLIGKNDYFTYGGHKAVWNELMDNMAFGMHIHQKKGKVICFSGKGAISMRMYPDGFVSLCKGWSKSFASGAAKVSITNLIATILWLSLLVTFVTNFHLEYAFEWVAVYLLIVLHLRRTLAVIGGFGIFTSLLFPVHLLFFIVLFIYSFFQTFMKKNVTWKGRKIDI
ncbi:4,4'-diaponeurosporenoate glycosyltransferase [Bacillus sp. THAF10]|uniref:glycosyltransferase n=1 Tax=Bacillus sp. THAF10 TaxID=2587848 RepID=UPI0012679AF4|nr:glycosyltransferase family 2 protein [Bacillus sp. THAF10]QFT88955.1 4,4'-diaponeurosporenoate glycosyltransferase [Bacillus sp. THAF10]